MLIQRSQERLIDIIASANKKPREGNDDVATG